MEKIAIFYGPLGGNTESVARQIAKALVGKSVVLIPVKDATEVDVEPYDFIIFGGPTLGAHTWSDGTKHNDWDQFLVRLTKMNLKGKACAIFGLGDHIGYAHHFVDDIGVLAERLESNDARLIGFVPVAEYEFEQSKAQRGDVFLGLPIDEDFDGDKTADRVNRWVSQLISEF
ncbi:MAG: flavodoxin domain-containing protein [Bacteroidales bacterium]|nr:flavodoxin domain-containing protein [Bacteroidales bacterium]